MLAIIYAIEGNSELEKKYAHMAISSGQNSDKLEQAILHYKVSAKIAKQTEAENAVSDAEEMSEEESE